MLKTSEFARWASKEELTDQALAEACAEVMAGLIDAQLGGQVCKKRVALPGRGKRGSVRTLIAYRDGQRLIYLFGFAKNERDNITPASWPPSNASPATFIADRCRHPPRHQSRRAAGDHRMSRILKTVHDTARGLHKAGAMDAVTLREFDALCLPPVKPLSATQIRRIRQRSKASQAVFAAYLNTSPSTVQKWEVGAKSPSGPSLKLLHLVRDKGLDALI